MAEIGQEAAPARDGIRASHVETAPPEAAALAVQAVNVDLTQQLQFLYKSLDDNQNVIRFLDAKAAFAVALLSAMAGKILSGLSTYFPQNGQPLWLLLLFYGFASTIVLGTFIVFRIVFPTSNPSANCRPLAGPAPPFFLCEMEPRRFGRIFTSNPRFSQLAQDHESYLEQIRASDTVALVRVMSGEVLKVSYIRQIKMDRLAVLARLSALSAILFMALVVTDAMNVKTPVPQLVHLVGPVPLGPVTVASIPPCSPVEHVPTPNPPKRAVKSGAAQRR